MKNSISQEGKELAESILRDMQRNGEEITSGTRQALKDLGMDDEDLREPPMNKRNYIETIRKRQKHEFELDEDFRRKFGIKKNETLDQHRVNLQKEVNKLTGKIEDLTEKEKQSMKIETYSYDNSVEYGYPDEENFKKHFLDSHARIRETIDQANIDRGKLPKDDFQKMLQEENFIRRKFAQEDLEEEDRELQGRERSDDSIFERKMDKRKQSYYNKREKEENKKRGFGDDLNKMWSKDD